MAYDLAIFESGNGGELQIKGNDIEATEGILTQAYLAWFGGNTQASTTGTELETQQRFDWWGNSLLYSEDIDGQFNSSLERTLSTTAINSAGRLQIERAAIDDLLYLRNFADIAVTVSILSNDRVQVSAQINEPDNQEDKELRIIWDATKGEVIQSIII